MLIINDNQLSESLPVYEVQEVTVKEALALIKSAQLNSEDPPVQQLDRSLFIARDTSSRFQVISGPCS